MKWVSYGWSALIGLILLVTATLVVNTFSSRFERVVIDLLVLIYIGMVSLSTIQSLASMERATADRDRFLELMAAAGDQRFEADVFRASKATDDDDMSRKARKLYIQSPFMFLACMITLFNLFGAIL